MTCRKSMTCRKYLFSGMIMTVFMAASVFSGKDGVRGYPCYKFKERFMRRLLLVVAAGLLTGNVVVGGVDYPVYGKLNESYVTPHITWAKPYYNGKIKVLVIAPMGGQRDTVELAQRFDLDYTPLMVMEYNQFHNPKMYLPIALEEIQEAFDQGLVKDYDVIIIGKVEWEILPHKYRFMILEKVKKGAGLVYICPPRQEELAKVFEKPAVDENNFILSGIPARELPVFAKAAKSKFDILKLSEFGRRAG